MKGVLSLGVGGVGAKPQCPTGVVGIWHNNYFGETVMVLLTVDAA